jgi:hypothetical protein
MLYVTSLTTQQADPADLLAYVRGHRGVEVLHWIRDVTYREDACSESAARPTSPPRYATTPAKTAVSSWGAQLFPDSGTQ